MCYTINMSKDVPAEVSAYFRQIGKKSGQKINKEIASGLRDKDYFSKISKMRKTFGRQKKQTPEV